MADIELVIKIPEDVYKTLKTVTNIVYGFRSGKTFVHTCLTAIRNGTPLEQRLDKAYEDFGKLEAGDSYIIMHGKRVSTDTAYAMDGIELFINFIKGEEK